MQEFIYYTDEALEFPLDESIHILPTSKQVPCIVSNKPINGCEVYAREIEFYQRVTQDGIAKKIENIKKLYDVAMARFDGAKEISYEYEVGNKLLIVGLKDEYDNAVKLIQKDDFEIYHVHPEWVVSLKGCIGNLQLQIQKDGKQTQLDVDQILWFNASDIAKKQSGTLDPVIIGLKEALEQLKNNTLHYSYTNFLTYNPDICQYRERREFTCAKCEQVCPSVAITADESKRHLRFSMIDCLGCGGCVSVCPSGALDYAPNPKDSIYECATFYKDAHPLIIPKKMVLDCEVELKEGILPYMIEGEKFLDEAALLTILQQSGSQAVFYSDFISKGTGEAIALLNSIYQKAYGVDAVLVAQNPEMLQKACRSVAFVKDSFYALNMPNAYKRKLFSSRLQAIIGERDLGTVATHEYVTYGEVKVNENNCTLCLSCVGACNVGALIADTSNNSLRFNASLCTMCGYCEPSCPEKDCLSIDSGYIRLHGSWFESKELAKDELFACIECGKEFATQKSIAKIAALMAPVFASTSKAKERTLYCCDSCKPKIMIQEGLLNA
jgi:ferredoxin